MATGRRLGDERLRLDRPQILCFHYVRHAPRTADDAAIGQFRGDSPGAVTTAMAPEDRAHGLGERGELPLARRWRAVAPGVVRRATDVEDGADLGDGKRRVAGDRLHRRVDVAQS